MTGDQRGGDARILARLVREHHLSMVRFAMSFVRSRAAAEDVVQDTWVAVMTGLPKFEGRSSIVTWIYGILINKAKSRGASDARMVSLPEDGDGPADGIALTGEGPTATRQGGWDQLDPERIVAGRGLWRHAVELIETLPPMQRAVLVLHDVEGQPPDAICRLLDLTPVNQRVLLSRARSRLRAELGRLVGS